VSLTSDPHAWPRPYFAALAQDHTFAFRAPSTQFAALCEAVRDDQPAKAALMREWSPAAQESALRWLATCVTAGSAERDVELWNHTKRQQLRLRPARHLAHAEYFAGDARTDAAAGGAASDSKRRNVTRVSRART
jgi:hypothetical protein